jgi:hypothetical protein
MEATIDDCPPRAVTTRGFSPVKLDATLPVGDLHDFLDAGDLLVALALLPAVVAFRAGAQHLDHHRRIDHGALALWGSRWRGPHTTVTSG